MSETALQLYSEFSEASSALDHGDLFPQEDALKGKSLEEARVYLEAILRNIARKLDTCVIDLGTHPDIDTLNNALNEFREPWINYIRSFYLYVDQIPSLRPIIHELEITFLSNIIVWEDIGHATIRLREEMERTGAHELGTLHFCLASPYALAA